MSSLFEMFDPTCKWNSYMGLLSSFIIIVMIPSTLFLAPSLSTMGIKKFSTTLHLELKKILNSPMPGTTWFLITLFWFIFMNNFMSLFPHISTATQYIAFTLKLAFPLWAGHMIYSWFTQPNFMFAHLVPKGTPMALWSFMVLIELISSIIRPLTLSIRLMANITGGHVMLSVLSSFASLDSKMIMTTITVLSILIIFIVLEIAVSLIQAYVFTLLSTLYLEEVQTKTMLTN